MGILPMAFSKMWHGHLAHGILSIVFTAWKDVPRTVQQVVSPGDIGEVMLRRIQNGGSGRPCCGFA
jgi:hypothetical protein